MEQKGGIVATIQEKLGSIAEKLNFSKDRIIELSLCTGIGFLCGLLCKRFFSCFMVMVSIVAMLVVAHHYELISLSFNMVRIEQLLGVKLFWASGGILENCWAIIKANGALSLGAVVGFLIGLRFG